MDNLDREDLFSDIDFDIKNNLGEFKDEFTELCPWVDEKLIEHLKIQFGYEMGFNKDISFDEYKYRTGIVEVIRYLQEQHLIQTKEK